MADCQRLTAEQSRKQGRVADTPRGEHPANTLAELILGTDEG
jgi:hypothetical protein